MMDVQMDMVNQGVQVDYSLAVVKKVMDTQELAAQEIEKMMPKQPTPPMGKYIDTYA